jgi:hypothetical protein
MIDWENILAKLIETVTLLLISVAIPYAISWIKAKTKNETLLKLIERAENLVENCVEYTSQTFVNALKKEGKFTKEEGEIAFNMSKERILSLMTAELQAAIEECFGDVNLWIETQIETVVLQNNHFFPVEEKPAEDKPDEQVEE